MRFLVKAYNVKIVKTNMRVPYDIYMDNNPTLLYAAFAIPFFGIVFFFMWLLSLKNRKKGKIVFDTRKNAT